MPNFFGGLAQGLQGGGFGDALAQLVAAKRQRKASEAIVNQAMSGGQPQQPPQGASPNPLAALAALHGGSQAPAPQPAPQPAPFTPGAPVAPGQPDPLAPQPAQPPAPKPPPDPNLSATAQPDQQFADPLKEAQQTLGAMIRSIKAANPKIDPRTLMDAVHTQLNDMKGLAPLTKATMMGQVAYLRAQTDAQYKSARLTQYDNDWMVKFMNAKTAEERTRLTGEYQKGRLNIEQEGVDERYYATDVGAKTREDVANIGAGSRIQVANINGKYRLQGIDTQQEGAGSRAQAALDGKHGAAIASGLSKFLSLNPGADPSQLDAVTQALESAYGTHTASQPTSQPAPKGGGGIPANVQQFAKEHGLTVIRRRSDGKYDAKAKDGTPGIIG
jgi:hypothetical protein